MNLMFNAPITEKANLDYSFYFNLKEYHEAQTRQKINCLCHYCRKPFQKRKNSLYNLMKVSGVPFCTQKCHYAFKRRKRKLVLCSQCNKPVFKSPSAQQATHLFCSKICHNKSMINKISLTCLNCQKPILRIPSRVGHNNFCSKSCGTHWSNTHKTSGYTRSKIEVWIQQKLTQLYPHLSIVYNGKSVINSELDIYIPSLKLAFELNGIVHYEPIFGAHKLNKIKINDTRKFLLCQQNSISLAIIDTSKLKYFKEEKATQFLEIIVNIINESINNLS